MRRFALVFAAVLSVCVILVLAHYALIEVGREVIVLRTQDAEGEWLETRLWIVDEGGFSWLHGADSRWMSNLRARPIVEIERDGESRRYVARPVPGPHPRVHELLRAKYGLADWWVRTIGPDNEYTTPVRLEPVEADSERGARAN
jgi:hypothetical protein